MTRDDILAALICAESFVSGESISRSLGITRAAVSQAVKSLRLDGYEIESATNRGYRLLSSPDTVTAGSLQAFLGKERMQRVLCYDVTDSTNLRLQEAALSSEAPGGLIAIADGQTGGRGRRGRTFASPRGMGIYLSILLRPETMGHKAGVSAADWTAVTSWVSVAVCSAIETVYGVRPGIKWVNDLLLNGRKICGILTQMELETETGEVRDVIAGIGVNVQETAEDFPEDLRDIATSLYQETGKRIPRVRLAAEMIRELDSMCAAWPDASPEYLARYRADSLAVGRKIRVLAASGEKKAIAESIGDDFSLQVRYEDGTRESLHGGEITIRPA